MQREMALRPVGPFGWRHIFSICDVQLSGLEDCQATTLPIYPLRAQYNTQASERGYLLQSRHGAIKRTH